MRRKRRWEEEKRQETKRDEGEKEGSEKRNEVVPSRPSPHALSASQCGGHEKCMFRTKTEEKHEEAKRKVGQADEFSCVYCPYCSSSFLCCFFFLLSETFFNR